MAIFGRLCNFYECSKVLRLVPEQKGAIDMRATHAALQAIEIGLAYNLHCPFVLGDEKYIMLGQAQDLANAYVCIWLSTDGVAQALVLVTFDPDRDSADVRHLERHEPQVWVGTDRWISCTFLAFITAQLYMKIIHLTDESASHLEGVLEFAERTIRLAMEVGLFNGQGAYDHLMNYGAKSMAEIAAGESPGDATMLSDVRARCKPDDLESMLFYAKVLVGSRAVEIIMLAIEGDAADDASQQ